MLGTIQPISDVAAVPQSQVRVRFSTGRCRRCGGSLGRSIFTSLCSACRGGRRPGPAPRPAKANPPPEPVDLAERVHKGISA